MLKEGETKKCANCFWFKYIEGTKAVCCKTGKATKMCNICADWRDWIWLKSEHFTLNEMCKSATADQNKIINHPSPLECQRIKELVEGCLEPIRNVMGKPIRVTSGYRCKQLNKLVGGKATSQHTKGEAADLQGANVAETRRIFEIARELGCFDQLLYERSSTAVWVHISYKTEGNRQQAIDNYKV